MTSTREISIIAIFSSLIIASDFALFAIPNVKLVFTLTFASAYSFGIKIGASIAIISELVWGVFSPYGFGGPIIPFLIGGNLIYVFAGYGASKIWGQNISPISSMNIAIGAVVAVCAFLFDLLTNFGTALIEFWPKLTLTKFLIVLGFGFPFMVFHELGDFIIGSALAPLIIVYFRRFRLKENAPVTTPLSAPKSINFLGGHAN